MVFYRKYRPQKIDDLDNAALRETLQSILQKEAAHAFLFTGPKGLGKTSTARIIAKVVNCTGRKDTDSSIEPCNVCDECVSITNGTNMDVLEIDAASNRGIDEIRDLKEKIRLSPVSAKKKVYIIDEVHMLTTEAFNALLKTLEEPPSHAMFILCTTEPHKVPATILSRCFHIAFKPATKEELVRAFQRIATGENLSIDPDIFETIASLADGGFRDGVKILEELVSISNGKPITKEFVEEKYKVASVMYHVSRMIGALAAKDTKQGLQIVDELVSQGVDLRHFIQQVMQLLHEELLMQVGVKKQEKKNTLDFQEIKKLFELFSKASLEMKHAVLPQLPLELAIIEYCQKEEAVVIDEVVSVQVPAPIEKVVSAESSGEPKEVTVTTLRKQVGTMAARKALYGEDPTEKKPEKKAPAQADVDLLHTSPEGEVAQEWLDALWKGMIAEVKNHNHTIAGVLRGCRIVSYDRKELVIEAAYQFHKERLDELKTRDALSKICKMLTGKDVSVKVELKK